MRLFPFLGYGVVPILMFFGGIVLLSISPGPGLPRETSLVPIVLTTDTPQQEEDLVRALEARSFTQIYSPLTLELSFTNTFELQSITLPEVLELSSRDPRYSPFFSVLGEFFYPNSSSEGYTEGPRRMYIFPQVFPDWVSQLQEGIRVAGLSQNLFREAPSPVVYWVLVALSLGVGLSSVLVQGGGYLSVLGICSVLVVGGANSGSSLVLLPLLSFLWGSIGAIFEVRWHRVLDYGLWFRLRHHSLGALLTGYFRVTRRSFGFRGGLGFLALALGLGLGVVIVGFMDGWFFFLRWVLALLLSGLPYLIYGVLKTVLLRRRSHPHFSFDPLLEPSNPRRYLSLLGLLVFIVQIWGLGYWSPQGSETYEEVDSNDYLEQAMIHDFFQTWFPYGVSFDEIEPGFRISVHEFTTGPEGLTYVPEFLDFSSWASSWNPESGTPGMLYQRLESYGLVRVVISPEDRVYSTTLHRLGGSWPLVALGLGSFGPWILGFFGFPSFRVGQRISFSRDYKGLAA